MILRRVMDHVRSQNWLAVGIDLVIVVVGVFIGIQLGNWNEARSAHVQEAEYLEQVRDEIASNADMARIHGRFVDRVVEGRRSGLQFLESDEPCTSECVWEVYDLECPAQASPEVARSAVEAIRAEPRIALTLTEWVGFIISFPQDLQQEIDMAEAAIAEIDRELEPLG